jgi:hypothetical protein
MGLRCPQVVVGDLINEEYTASAVSIQLGLV